MLRDALLATVWLVLCGHAQAGSADIALWQGVLRDATGHPVDGASVMLQRGRELRTVSTDAEGKFHFSGLAAGSYSITVRRKERNKSSPAALVTQPGEHAEVPLDLSDKNELVLHREVESVDASATGGERLSSRRVSGLPLNKRDFSQLLLLASGTQTDTNGAANFTQQFAVNGQRGTTAVFAIDGGDSTDPELGGATFSNFNVDAIQESRANSGVMPADFGRGAASFTDIVTKSGSDPVHAVIFELARYGAFYARH